MKPIKILLADDNEDILEILRITLSDKYDVITADNGEQALELIKAEKPDIIILDLVMPKMDGLTLCQTLKADEVLKEIPVIIITASTYNSDLPDGFWRIGAGSDEFITKPFEPKKLLEIVERLVRKKILKLDETQQNGKTNYM